VNDYAFPAGVPPKCAEQPLVQNSLLVTGVTYQAEFQPSLAMARATTTPRVPKNFF
jgi:hypothetical protein